jgi:methylphosphotriester-DNA--protein-cysteine methyltransferase
MVRHDQLDYLTLRSLIRHGQITYAGNKKLKIYGTLRCASGKRLRRENRVFFASEEDALQQEFRPCKKCMQEKRTRQKEAGLTSITGRSKLSLESDGYSDQIVRITKKSGPSN